MRTSSATGVIGAMVAGAIAAWLIGAAPAEACSCRGPVPACQGVWMSDAVFVGRVLDIANVKDEREPRRPSLRSKRVTLEVLEEYRGGNLLVPRDGASGVDVFTGQGGGDCGIEFKKGESYLVFARASADVPSLLDTGLCDRTRELSRALDDLPYLRSLATSSSSSSPSPPTSSSRGGRVYGYIDLYDPPVARRPPLSGPPERKRLADVPITLTSEGDAGVRKQTSTNESGQYEFTDLAPGKYRVAASLPEIYYVGTSGRSPSIVGELLDTRGCSEVNMFAAHDGRISGRLLDARGAPVAGLSIALLNADDIDSPYQLFSFTRALTNGDGVYELTRVPPGRFVVAINTERNWTTRELLQPRIMHPGVERGDDATRIGVGPGERVKLADWSMPASHAVVILRGTVTDANGQPMAGVDVGLAVGRGRDARPVGARTVTDAKGQFGLAALEGQRYHLQAHYRRTIPAAAGDAKAQTIYEPVASEPFVAAADTPWLTLRIETTPPTP